MKNAASISGRDKIRSRQIAQKIIFSHVKNYMASLLWGIDLDCDFGESLRLPTIEDYNAIIVDLENDNLPVSLRFGDDLVAIPVPNVYYKTALNDIKGRHEVVMIKRFEDKGRLSIPKIVYLVVSADIFKDGANKKFKSINIERFLRDIRAVALSIPGNDVMDNFIKEEVRDLTGYAGYLRKGGYSNNQVRNSLREIGIKGRRGRPSMVSHKSIVRKEIYKNDRKKFDDVFRKLRKLGMIF